MLKLQFDFLEAKRKPGTYVQIVTINMHSYEDESGIMNNPDEHYSLVAILIQDSNKSWV